MVSSAVIVSNWIAFLCLSASFLGLLIFSLKYKGPTGKEAYYNGFREQNMLGVFINLFCAVAYFAKVVAAHANDDGFKVFTTIKYLDYLTTCPLLTLDLLWNLEAPYKVSAGALVLTCLTFAVATDSTPAPANYVWFGAGLSFFMFSYSFILTIVKERITFFANCARDSHAKKSIGYLKLALFSYFGIWIFFPVLWILSPKAIGLIGDDVQHVFHCILDVIAKSCYGFALLYFKVFFDKKLIAAGVDEEEFHKFSKDVTTHKNDDEDDDEDTKKKKSKQKIRLPGSMSRECSPTPSDRDMEMGGGPSYHRSMSRASARSQEMELGGMPLTSFSTRGNSVRGSPTRNPLKGYSSRRPSVDDAQVHDSDGMFDDGSGMQMGHPVPNMDGPGSASGESEDEAEFVERARRQWEMQRVRSRSTGTRRPPS